MSKARIVDIETVKRPGGCRRLIVPLLFLIAAGLVAVRFLVPAKRPVLPRAVEVTDVRSAIEQDGDSLRVVVSWRLVLPRGPELAESTRVEVGISEGAQSQVATVPANEHADTLKVPAPTPGQTASGYSCVAAMTRGRLAPENCTPWQFVRPGAGPTPADSAPATPGKPRASAAPRVSRIVMQPEGMQVDPDVGARCAAWQRQNPGRSVWISVNRQAIRECTGPNGKPTVAQFCAFAVLADGRRVKTLSAEKVEYCDELFRKWREERTA
ncbi:MAG TPA: hypothetical protein VH764_01190 [Gemmatimonadales bacterium]